MQSNSQSEKLLGFMARLGGNEQQKNSSDFILDTLLEETP
jgi:hypothetical protein